MLLYILQGTTPAMAQQLVKSFAADYNLGHRISHRKGET